MASVILFLAISGWLCSSELAPPTDGYLPLAYDASFSGSGTDHVSKFSCQDNWCSLGLDQRSWQSVVYQHQYGWNLDLMNMFSVSTDGQLAVVWIYCNGTEAIYAFSEDYNHPNVGEEASGQCQFIANRNINTRVTFPAITSAPNTSIVAPNNIYVSGSSIFIENNEGWVVLADGTYNITIFTTINCATCGNPGWYELHGFLNNSYRKKICFTIFYLQFENPDSVLMTYSLCLSDLSTPLQRFPATWSGNLNSSTIRLDDDEIGLIQRKFYHMRHDAMLSHFRN